MEDEVRDPDRATVIIERDQPEHPVAALAQALERAARDLLRQLLAVEAQIPVPERQPRIPVAGVESPDHAESPLSRPISPSSSITGTPSFSALASFVPGLSPAMTYAVFFDTDPTTRPPA